MIFKLFCVLALFSFVACSKDNEKRNDDKAAHQSSDYHQDEPSHQPLEKIIRLKPDVIKAANIQTTKANYETLSNVLTLSGEIVANPDHTARVSIALTGRLASVNFSEGQNVKKGAVLATLQIPDLGKIRSALAAANAKAKTARINSERLKGLVESRLASEQQYLDAVTEAETREAEVSALSEQAGLLGVDGPNSAPGALAIRAPISGTIVGRDAVIGQPVSTEQVIATIADLREVWFIARVFEKDLAQLKIGQPAEVSINAYPKQQFLGALEYIGQQTDPLTRTINARIRLKNTDGKLRLGLFGTTKISLGEKEPQQLRLVVPRTAVTDIGDKHIVFVQHEDGDFERHEVTLGRTSFGAVEILSGLRAGEAVVSEGAFTLKSILLKQTFGEDE